MSSLMPKSRNTDDDPTQLDRIEEMLRQLLEGRVPAKPRRRTVVKPVAQVSKTAQRRACQAFGLQPTKGR